MSMRETLQTDLAQWIASWATAPYGVITGYQSRQGGPGKARVITFGLARTLDASLLIWSPTRLELQTSRTTQIERFDTADAFRQYCVKTFGAPQVGQT